MKKELLALSIGVLLLVISFSGCVEEDTVSAEEIKEMLLQALENVTSHKYSSEGITVMTTINEPETNITEMVPALTGEVDILNKKMKLFINMTYTADSVPFKEEHIIIYHVDNITYFGNKTNENITWWSSYAPEVFWDAYSLLEQFTTFLENGTEDYNNTELKRLSDETFEGVDCYILQFKGYRNDSAGYNLTGFQYIEYDVKYWVSKDTSLLKRCHVESIFDLSGIYSSFGNRSISVSEMDMLFHDYNVPLIIELPPEAENTSWGPI